MSLVIDWSEEKNSLLKKSRNISFEDVEFAILNKKIIDIVPHFNKDKYPHQKLIIVCINDYIYYVPFVYKESNIIFLKTIIPSRKYNKKY